MVANSLPGVTALVPHIGYDRASQIAQHVHAHCIGRRQAALEIGGVGAADLDAWADMRRMSMSGWRPAWASEQTWGTSPPTLLL